MEKDDYNFAFINREKKETEIVVLSMYAYDKLQLPKKFKIMF